jgi:hypothetical protein
VTDGGPYGQAAYYGRIDTDGTFAPGRVPMPQDVQDLLVEFSDDPAGVAARIGKLTGSCVYCQRGLTDPRSLTEGYGPICARNYGLPWGGKAGRTAVLAVLPQIPTPGTPVTMTAPTPTKTPITPAQAIAQATAPMGYVNLYTQQRVYGGPEEGGWYYDTGKPQTTQPFYSAAERDALVQRDEAWAAQKNAGQPDYDDPSCPTLWGVWVQDAPGSAFPAEVPTYG